MKKFILAAPFLIIISIVVEIVLLLLGFWLLAIIVLVVSFIFNWWSETFAMHLFGKKSGDYDLRVMTFNVNRAHEISINKGSTEEFIAFILQQDADLILLQEYNAELYPEVQERLGKAYPYGSGIESTSRFKSVFSKFLIESCEQLMVDANDPQYELFQNAIYCKRKHDGLEVLPICKLKIRVGERLLQVFNCHLMSNNYSVVIRNLRNKGKSLTHGVLPVLHRIDFGYKTRELQVQIIGEHIDDSMPSLICGDFNDVGGSSPLRIMEKFGFSDAWWKGGFGMGFTFHGMSLRLRLDHIFYSAQSLLLKKVLVPHSEYSDHNPLVADFVIV